LVGSDAWREPFSLLGVAWPRPAPAFAQDRGSLRRYNPAPQRRFTACPSIINQCWASNTRTFRVGISGGASRLSPKSKSEFANRLVQARRGARRGGMRHGRSIGHGLNGYDKRDALKNVTSGASGLGIEATPQYAHVFRSPTGSGIGFVRNGPAVNGDQLDSWCYILPIVRPLRYRTVMPHFHRRRRPG